MSDIKDLVQEQLAADRGLRRNDRFARGEITEEEMVEYWKNPEEPLFEHTLAAKGFKKETIFRIRGLTSELRNDLIVNISDVWGITDLEQMKRDFEKFVKHNSHPTPRLLNAEYYVATDVADKPFATIGLYSYDIQGAAGLATRKQLDSRTHSLITGVGWYGVSKNYQSTGIGRFLLEWVEKMAKHRGVDTMFIETDDDVNTTKARSLYEKFGYQLGFDVPDYFGAGRDLATYWINVNEGNEKAVQADRITEASQDEVLSLAKRIFSPEQFQEFEVVLKLLLQQPQDQPAILEGDSLLIRNSKGKLESFAILSKGSYANQADMFWDGTDPSAPNAHTKLILAVKDWVRELGKDVLIVSREGQDDRLGILGFHHAKEGIPGVFAKGTDTKFLLYTKKFSNKFNAI